MRLLNWIGISKGLIKDNSTLLPWHLCKIDSDCSSGGCQCGVNRTSFSPALYDAERMQVENKVVNTCN
ncbi:hypothetical protein C5167_040797 [Papaver somniferum]|uniref:Uncharacterized protein n=1 Tax=Papaver somniferum TaxID=3469 RepID=A0A4Y7IK60_PAPSO|nr:hypothetical protein C5167_040797 [Papaver somniferum]